jgi:hypothetical protein
VILFVRVVARVNFLIINMFFFFFWKKQQRNKPKFNQKVNFCDGLHKVQILLLIEKHMTYPSHTISWLEFYRR